MVIIKMLEKTIAYFSEISIMLLGLVGFILLVVIFKEDGISGVWDTVRVDVFGIFIKYIPVLLVFFTITGALNHLQKKHSEEFHDIVSGKKGTVKMVLLAAALPGPAGGKQLQDAWNLKDSNKTKLLLCLVGMMALNVNLILFRSKVLGGPLTLIWFGIAATLLFEIWAVSKLKPWMWF